MDFKSTSSRVKSVFSVALKREDLGIVPRPSVDRHSSENFYQSSPLQSTVDFESLTHSRMSFNREVLKEAQEHVAHEVDLEELKKKYGIGSRDTSAQSSYIAPRTPEHRPSYRTEFTRSPWAEQPTEYQLLQRRYQKMEEFYKTELAMANEELEKFKTLYYKLKHETENRY